MKSFLIFPLVGLLVVLPSASAQDFALDRFNLVSGAGTSTGSLFAVNGAIHQAKADPMSGSSFTLDGRFLSLIAPVPPGSASTTIFDNTAGSNNGIEFANTTTWLANKFCLGPQSYTLDSVTLPLSSRDNPPVSTVRLQIYSDDPVTGKPSASIGPMMNLSGWTNPITFTVESSSNEKQIMWTPATPFILAANRCYWTVLSVESGEVLQKVSETMPTGAAAVFGRSSSTDAGATWQSADNQSNRKMLIQGAAATPPELAIRAPTISGNALSFNFHGVSGRTYVIECRTNVSEGDWTTLPETTRVGTGATIELTLTNILSESKRFYRVKRLP